MGVTVILAQDITQLLKEKEESKDDQLKQTVVDMTKSFEAENTKAVNNFEAQAAETIRTIEAEAAAKARCTAEVRLIQLCCCLSWLPLLLALLLILTLILIFTHTHPHHSHPHHAQLTTSGDTEHFYWQHFHLLNCIPPLPPSPPLPVKPYRLIETGDDCC